MAKSMARAKRPTPVDTEDHITERVLEFTTWAEQHRRTVVVAGIALVAVVAAAFYYQDYREKLAERASVRLQEIQLSTQSADAETIRSELRLFIDQFGGTPYVGQARVALGELELRRDSLAAAVRALEPVADLESAEPLAFTAAGMIAAAYEQGGQTDRAVEWYERIERGARFDYQRHQAMAEQARLATVSGSYPEAARLYERLVEETGDDATGQSIYRVRLGEVRALQASGAPPVVIPTPGDVAEFADDTASAPADSRPDE